MSSLPYGVRASMFDNFLIPYRNLRAKPSTSSRSPENPSPKDQVRKTPDSPPKEKQPRLRKCMAPKCVLKNCQLPTHITYKKPRQRVSHGKETAESAADQHDSAHLVYIRRLLGQCDLSRLRIRTEGMEALPALPIEDETLQQANVMQQVRGLFNRFFGQHFEDIIHVHCAPCSRPYTFKQATLALALKEPLYCISLVALCHFHEIKDQAWCDGSADDFTHLLCTKLLEHCQAMLQDVDEVCVDLLVFAIAVLCYYDLSAGRVESLLIHREGLIALSSKIGGYHNLCLSLPHALWIDRSMAIFLAKEPQFSDPGRLISGLDFAADARYGAEFEQPGLMLAVRADTRFACKAAARLMDLIEAKDTVDATKPPVSGKRTASPSADYFLFLRNTTDVQLASLLVHRSGLDVLEDCILLATKIVVNIVAFADCLPTLTSHLSERIWERLGPALYDEREIDGADTCSTWGKFSDVLLWILVISALPRGINKTHQLWADTNIAKISTLYFGQPVMWHDDLVMRASSRRKTRRRPGDVWLVLSKFVWCASLKSRFLEICSRMPT